MASRLYIVLLVIAFCVTNAVPSNGQKGTNNIKYDTAKTAIIPFDKKVNFPFDNSYKPAVLTQSDINNVDSLLIACVTEYNASLENENKLWVIDLKKYDYRKQLVVVTNRKGEKEVWVNCFCNTWDERWKTGILFVYDGGNCYFNFKINLTAKKFYDLLVNGEA
jgi:hypothetical protein